MDEETLKQEIPEEVEIVEVDVEGRDRRKHREQEERESRRSGNRKRRPSQCVALHSVTPGRNTMIFLPSVPCDRRKNH